MNCAFILGLALFIQLDAIKEQIIPAMPTEVFAHWMMQESTCNATAVSDTGDYGLLQISEQYEAYFIHAYWQYPHSFDVFNPIDNATLALLHLKALYAQYGNYGDAFAAYNAGGRLHIGRSYSNKIMSKWQEYNSQIILNVIIAHKIKSIPRMELATAQRNRQPVQYTVPTMLCKKKDECYE